MPITHKQTETLADAAICAALAFVILITFAPWFFIHDLIKSKIQTRAKATP